MSLLTDRIDRWADNLPSDEPIAITKDEKYEMALECHRLGAVSANRLRKMSLDEIVRSIEAGVFEYRQHKVVVL